MSAIIITASPTRSSPSGSTTDTGSGSKKGRKRAKVRSLLSFSGVISQLTDRQDDDDDGDGSRPGTGRGGNERTPLLGSSSNNASHNYSTNNSVPTNASASTSTSRPPSILDPTGRTQPLIETLSKPHFITCLLGVFSANFVFAFQTTSIPTLATGISSGFEHAELGSYLGGAFALANTAGKWGMFC